MFANISNVCLRKQSFQKKWKQKSFFLLPKSNKSSHELTSYRAFGLVDMIGKAHDKLIRNRIEQSLESSDGLLNSQFGSKTSPVDAIKMVTITAETIEEKRWMQGNKKYCLVILLDIKDAFKLANSCVVAALQERGVPPYFINIVARYSSSRNLRYEIEEGCS